MVFWSLLHALSPLPFYPLPHPSNGGLLFPSLVMPCPGWFVRAAGIDAHAGTHQTQYLEATQPLKCAFPFMMLL